MGMEGQRELRQDEERRRREEEERRQAEDFEKEDKHHQRRMEDNEREQADRRRRQQKELEREEEQNQSELRDEHLRAQTAREEATLRKMRLITSAAEAERRTAEVELREMQERVRRARHGEGMDIHAVMDGPEVAMSYVPEGGGGGRFAGGQGGGGQRGYQQRGYNGGESSWGGQSRGQPWREGQYGRDTRGGGPGAGLGGAARGGRGGKRGKGGKGGKGGTVMYVRTGQVPGSKDFTGCTPCWERAHLSRFDHSREECPRYWDAIVTGLPWKDGELWEGGRFFCEGCTEPTPDEVAKAKAAGLAPQQPGNMTTQQARGDAGQKPVYLVEDSAFEVYYADVELPERGSRTSLSTKAVKVRARVEAGASK